MITKLFAGVALSGLLAVTGHSAYRAVGGCCEGGAECCYPSSPCCVDEDTSTPASECCSPASPCCAADECCTTDVTKVSR